MVNLQGAEIRALYLVGTHTGPISGDGLRVKNGVHLRYGFKAEGEVRVLGATIGGNLDCIKGHFNNSDGRALSADGAEVKGGVFLRDGFRAEGEVRLPGATIGGNLECDKGHFNNPDGRAVTADSVKVKGNVFLRDGFKAEGEVVLLGATIGGNVVCIKGHFINPDGMALHADGVSVEGSVFLREGFKAEGEVRLPGATIDGNLECDKGHFNNPNGVALNAERAEVKGCVFLREDFTAKGEVRLLVATIGGNLNCRKGHFTNPGRYALRADGAEVKGSVFLREGFKANGMVEMEYATIGGVFVWTGVASPTKAALDLRSAQIDTLWVNEESWPEKGNLFLDGLIYDKIDDDTLTVDATTRIKWLRLQPSGKFWPQPYEQLAEVLTRSGHEKDAKKVLIAKNEDPARLKHMPFFQKCGHHFLGWTIGYGYRPWRPVWMLAVIILLGWGLFDMGFQAGVMAPTDKNAYAAEGGDRRVAAGYPTFNPLMYSLDVFVPVVNLHQGKYWLPDATRSGEVQISEKLSVPISGHFLWYWLWVEIIMGWTLSTLLVVGLTGLVRG